MDSLWLQVLFGGLTSGSIYALVAVGLAVIYRATRVINFAHGEFVVIGALTAASLVDPIGLPLAAAALFGVAAAGATGLLFERLVLRPMSDKPVFVLILITLGSSIAFRGAASCCGARIRFVLPPFSGETPWRLGGAAVLPQALWVLGVTAVIMVLIRLRASTHRVWEGSCARARKSCSGPAGRYRCQIDDCLDLMSPAPGSGGVAGVLISPIAAIDFQAGLLLTIKGLTAAIIGGLDRISGVVLGGLLLGVIEAYASASSFRRCMKMRLAFGS